MTIGKNTVMIRPRMTDYYGVYKAQAELDFAIPFLSEDIPLYVDPFLLWRSPSFQDKALHGAVLNSFNHLGYLARTGSQEEAVGQLIVASECDEVGLGHSGKRRGARIGLAAARSVIELFKVIPQYEKNGFTHFEEIQFYVDGISRDRVSDIACSFLKSFLVDYTMDQCETIGIPAKEVELPHLYDLASRKFVRQKVRLPVNPENNDPILLVPKRWLRFAPWLSFDEYFRDYCPVDPSINPGQQIDRVKVLAYNRAHYGAVESYVKEKERTFEDCKNDPLFSQIPISSAKRKLQEIKKLNSGKGGNADKAYEDASAQLLASLLYPHLDFASEQSRTDSGVLIRDLIFYNNRTHPFLAELFDEYGSKQLVFEIKNVASIERDHINQLNRYLSDDLGKFGVFVTRNELPKARQTSLVDLWSGQRRCIVYLTDADLEQMVEIFESKQRLPLDVLKKKHVEFRRACPS